MFLCSLNTLTAILLLLSVIQAVKSDCQPKSETRGDLASVSLLEDYENATDECEDNQGLTDEDSSLISNNENGPSSLEYSSNDKNMMILVALSVAGLAMVLIMVNIKLFFEMRKKIKAKQQESRDQNVDR